jgi:transcriptional regulator with XRE-family HTH domain
MARRMSQLTLAAEAKISARHLCFLETGRAHPSRDMVQLLATALDVSLAERNAMLLAAGYAPAFGGRKLDAPEMEHVRRALAFILDRQEPYPALVVDGEWNARQCNHRTAASRVSHPDEGGGGAWPSDGTHLSPHVSRDTGGSPRPVARDSQPRTRRRIGKRQFPQRRGDAGLGSGELLQAGREDSHSDRPGQSCDVAAARGREG